MMVQVTGWFMPKIPTNTFPPSPKFPQFNVVFTPFCLSSEPYLRSRQEWTEQHSQPRCVHAAVKQLSELVVECPPSPPTLRLGGCGSDPKQGHTKDSQTDIHFPPAWLSVPGWELEGIKLPSDSWATTSHQPPGWLQCRWQNSNPLECDNHWDLMDSIPTLSDRSSYSSYSRARPDYRGRDHVDG